ncbi:hypothetical protein E2C01_046893 [Portunus trituberculatus]|uniref:Uncharacterized protein n=1 Tax=Portunus trituberculatus TaxID=210409 RepID=A0A5B7FYY7_PORTR|nr:hypothetical protein [Portunus trituberculatus]
MEVRRLMASLHSFNLPHEFLKLYRITK